jgi:hypothetical protein
MMSLLIINILILSIFIGVIQAANEIYVSPSGLDTNDGNAISVPVLTITRCAELAGSGGTCFLRGGRYFISESVVLTGYSNLNLLAYNNEIPIIDGTAKIQGGWTLKTSSPLTNLWETTEPQTVWQLFWSDSRLHLPPARWPNGAPWTTQGYNRDYGGWRYESLDSSFGNLTDDYSKLPSNQSLADTNKNMNGCVAVINNGHWKTMEAIVENHTAGSNTFQYDTLNAGAGKPAARHPGDGKGRYYLEFCPQLIDAAGEWAYNQTTKKILLRSPNVADQNPNNVNIYGKNVTYGIVLNACSNININGLQFFGTTIVMWESTSCTVLNSDFLYPSFSKRALAQVKGNYNPTGSWYNGNKNQLKFTGAAPTAVGSKIGYRTNSTWRNNKFQYTDNAALSFSNSGLDTVYNNYFNHIDYSGVGYSFTILTNTKTGPITFSRNTIDTAGASAGLNTPGSIETDKNDFFKYCKMANGQTATNPTTMAFEEFTGECSQRPIAEYNYFTNMGLVQHDGAALQASSLVQRGTVYAYNWVMNTRKLGLRFDSGDDCIYGDNGTMHHNVVYGALGGIKSKGNDHIFYNNLVFESWQSEDLQILRYYPADQSCQPIGDRSVVVNNAGGTITGLATGNLDITSYAKYNAQYNYNEFVNTPKVRNLLRDYKNYDFRPRKDSSSLIDKGNSDAISSYDNGNRHLGSTVDIGAYEYGDLYYFIPGYQDTVPSFPIPPDNSNSVKYDADLMFLHARNAVKHELELYNDTTSSFELQETFYGKNNIFSNCTWEQNVTIQWRVRAMFADGSTKTSPTWSFTVPKKQDATVLIIPTDDAAVYEDDTSKQNNNFGNTQVLRVRDELSANTQRITSYLRFSLVNDVTTDLKNSGCDILVKGATLKMQVYTDKDIDELSLWSMNDTVWDEMVITGLNHPNGWENRLLSQTNLVASSIVTFDVKAYIESIYSNNIDVFTFGLTSTQNTANLKLYSKECADTGCQKPTLEVMLATTNCPKRVCQRRDLSSSTATATTTLAPIMTTTATAISSSSTTTTSAAIIAGTTTKTSSSTTTAATMAPTTSTSSSLDSSTTSTSASVPSTITTTTAMPSSTSTPPNMCCLALIASCRACQLGVTVKEFCGNHANYKGCKKESKPADEIGRACCMAHNAACNACALNMTKEEYCSTEKNYDVDGCSKPEALKAEIVIIIVVGSLILCLLCRYAIKKCVASNNGNRRNGREIQVTKSGGIIELGTRQFSIRTPTANPSHAVGLIQQRD